MRNRLRDWVPVFGAAAAASLFYAYYRVIEMDIGNLADVVREQGRILWASSSFVLNLAMMWCLIVSVLAIRRFLSAYNLKHLVAIFLGFTLLLAFIVWLVHRGEVAGEVGTALLERIPEQDAANVLLIVDINNAAAILVAVVLVLAFVFVGRGAEESSASVLADRIRWFNSLLYSAGVVLATGVYEVYWLFRWPASLDANRDSLEPLASSIATGAGLVFSSLLALIVVPPAVRLNRCLQAIMAQAAKNATNFEPASWMSVEGIDATPLRSLSGYVAVLLPAATGLLTKLPGW